MQLFGETLFLKNLKISDMDTCKCCTADVQLNFCPNCGQRKAKRIDAKYIKDELQYTLIHTNKGFFYSIKKIVKSPGRTAAEFIDGNRVNHYKPILMVFLLAGISAFLTNTFIHPVEIMRAYYEAHGQKNVDFMISVMGFLMKYNSLVMLLNIPLFALFSWLAFRKWGYNYYENVIACAYLLSAILIFSIVIGFPMQFTYRYNPDMYMIVPTLIAYAIMAGVSLWFYLGLYHEKNAGPVIVRLLVMYGSMVFIVTVVTIAAVVIYILMNSGKLPTG